MNKIVCGILLIVFSINAQAGFLIGYAVGASGNTSSDNSQATVLVSNTYDVITCCRESNDEQYCRVSQFWLKDQQRWETRISPAQFAGNAGYKIIHKIGFLSRPRGCDMIIMEVSK